MIGGISWNFSSNPHWSHFFVFGKKDAQQYSGCNHHGISVADVAMTVQDRLQRPCRGVELEAGNDSRWSPPRVEEEI